MSDRARRVRSSFPLALATLVTAAGLTGPSFVAAAQAGVTGQRPLSCGGQPVTIVGTPGSDRIEGTAADDVILARAGDDVVTARGGDDVICGRGGRDRARGGRGKDVVFGGRDRDILRGGRARDRLLGGRGADSLSGAGGPDLLSGGSAPDLLRGGKGSHDHCGGGRPEPDDGSLRGSDFADRRSCEETSSAIRIRVSRNPTD